MRYRIEYLMRDGRAPGRIPTRIPTQDHDTPADAVRHFLTVSGTVASVVDVRPYHRIGAAQLREAGIEAPITRHHPTDI